MLKRLLRKSKASRLNNSNTTVSFSKDTQLSKILISESLSINILELKKIIGMSSDMVIRKFNICLSNEIDAAIIFVDGLVETTMINENIMKPLMKDINIPKSISPNDKNTIFNKLERSILTVSSIIEITNFGEIFNGIFSGQTVLFIDGFNIAFMINTPGWESRGVQEPQTESVIRGPREGFTENLNTNLALLRRRIKSTSLIIENMQIGKFTNTKIAIAYIRDIANYKIVEELKKRLNRIEVDGILESGYIEEFIEDEPFSLFAQIGNTEKPDIVSAMLLEGRVAVITDGTPVVLTLPYLFVESLQANEDYYSRAWYSTFIRWIRFISFFLTVFLPGLFLSAQTYHFEMLPTPLIITMAATREGIPFPAFVEMLIMLSIFQIMKEASIRMPKPIGQAVSIVGSLVLGEAAVQAGLVSNPAVMVTALSSISGFVVVAQIDSVTILRFVFTILGASSGLFGMLIGVIFLLIHLASLRSFGVPYLSPLAPRTVSGLKDVFIRVPIWAKNKRPRVIGWKNPVRVGPNAKPQPPEDKEKDD